MSAAAPAAPVLYYAMGGGLGHLTRARAVLYTLGVADPVTILSASPLAADARVRGRHDLLAPDPALACDRPRYRAWLQHQFDGLRPRALYMDAFPAGIVGEFCDFPLPGIPVYHLARRLRWARYCRQLIDSVPSLTSTYVLEPLDPVHAALLQHRSTDIQPLRLLDPPTPPPRALVEHLHDLKQDRPLWLIVHAGSDAEVAALLRIAAEQGRATRPQPLRVLIAPRRPPHLPADVLYLDVYPAHPLFPLANRLITGGGFNVMRQAAPFADRHYALAFARRFDDQFARVAHHRRSRTKAVQEPA